MIIKIPSRTNLLSGNFAFRTNRYSFPTVIDIIIIADLFNIRTKRKYNVGESSLAFRWIYSSHALLPID